MSKITLETIRMGDGTLFPKEGQTVAVEYIGYLKDGTQFDSTYERGRPFKFKLRAGQVVRGWDEAISQLSLGEKARITMPPSTAYGENGIPGLIPKMATLIFEVELISIQ
eukprot:Rmarinus@m.21058